MRPILRNFALLAILNACSSVPPASTQSASALSPPRPNLVVLITVDQFRADYIDRFRPQLTGGFARLADAGAWFTNAHHDHAITETAPGHATLLSGRFPRSTGISNNRAGVEDPSNPLIVGLPTEPGASPYRFRGTTLVDWISAGDPGSRTLSVSMKDRAAILPVGKSRQNEFWYSVSGAFTTSKYYATALPSWVEQFNARNLPGKTAGTAWDLLLDPSAYPEPDSVIFEHGGADFTFPHRLPADSVQAASLMRITPWMDKITLAFALQGVNALGIGKGPHLDVLAVSLSGTDVIGHTYGPDSREMHDQFLRLDRELGTFLDSLFKLRDPSRIIIALTGDHGVASLPELNVEHASPPPVRVLLGPVILAERQRLRIAGIDTTAVMFDGLTVSTDRSMFAGHAVTAESQINAVADDLRKLPGVYRVDRFADLQMADTTSDQISRRWLHQFRAEDKVDLVVTLARMSIATLNVATHGSPYDYDSHVPIIFYGAPFKSGKVSDFVRTVDIAPTLAAALGIKPLEKLDGVPLSKAFK